VKAAAASYNFFLRRSPRWMNGYYAGVHLARLPILGGRVVASWCDDILEKERPDLVVSVHPIVNFAIAETRERQRSSVPFAIVLTDPYPPFWRGWAEPRADRTVVPTAEAARRLVELKINPMRITVGGMPVSRSFRKRAVEDSCATVRESLGLVAERFTLLLNAGSAGRATGERVLKELIAAPDLHERLQVVFLGGRNRRLAPRIARLRVPFPVAALDWTEEVAAVLDISDATFTKAGGLSIAEAMAKGVPVLVDACEGIMPQERGTARWLERDRLGWIVRDPADVVRILRDTPRVEWEVRRERARESVKGDGVTIARGLRDLLPPARPAPASSAGKTTLITGATGTLAPFLLHRLMHDADPGRLLCLVRRSDGPECVRRRIAQLCPQCAERVGKPGFEFVDGDVSVEIPVGGKVDAAWHFASDLRMDPDHADAVRQANLAGTRTVLDFAGRKGATLYYLSTAYVSGTRTGTIAEQELNCGQSFRNAYEESKAHSEQLVRDWMREHPGIVFRPSIVVGDARTGVSLSFQGLYRMIWCLWRLRERLLIDRLGGGLLPEIVLPLPVSLPVSSADTPLNIVAADYVAALMDRLHREPAALGETFHIVNPEPPSLKELLDVSVRLMGVRGIRLVESGAEAVERLEGDLRRLTQFLGHHVLVYFPYLTGAHPVFDMSRVREVLGEIPRHPPLDEGSLGRMYRFALEREFVAV
jgi:nucleoside-diphosphate-sugar epimerase/UDP-N-acetylglucosamine:LPS N-acetylglucosamine transferase